MRTIVLKVMSSRRCYDTHTYLRHVILDSPGDWLTLPTTSPRDNARSSSTLYKAKLPSLSSGCPRVASLPNIGPDNNNIYYL